MSGAGKPARLPKAARVSPAAVARQRAAFRQDHPAACRAGVWRYAAIHPLCAAARKIPARAWFARFSRNWCRCSAMVDGIEVLAKGSALPPFDLHCPLLSLPLAFGTEPATIPAGSLSQGTRSARRALARPSSAGRLSRRLRLVRLARPQERRQSLDLAFATRFHVCELAVCLFQPATGDARCRPRDIAALAEPDRPRPRAFRFCRNRGRHLAAGCRRLGRYRSGASGGCLGKPVGILLPHAADFRWMRERNDTPWYPTAKLLRQPAFGDWDSAIGRLADELREIAGAGAGRSESLGFR